LNKVILLPATRFKQSNLPDIDCGVMGTQYISEGLKRFIREQIQTVSRLEVLLLLHHHQPQALSLAEVAGELGVEDETAADQLAALEAMELVIHSPTEQLKYEYRPHNAAVGSIVDQLAASYCKQRVPILSMILSEHPDRVRLFAEAFRMIRRND
jgi:hypothetical protein